VITVDYQWRGAFVNPELNALHGEAFAHELTEVDWVARVTTHSLGWVTARRSGELIGFVNVAWDGAGHAFALDTIVRAHFRRHGVGARLMKVVIGEVAAAGCAWLHVDFVRELEPFYLGACGFQRTAAGLLRVDRDRTVAG
jgi:GNAT superfamily N-acetyltransferase